MKTVTLPDNTTARVRCTYVVAFNNNGSWTCSSSHSKEAAAIAAAASPMWDRNGFGRCKRVILTAE